MRILAFGDLESQVWGVCWLAGDQSSATLAIASGSSTARIEANLRAGGADGDRTSGADADRTSEADGDRTSEADADRTSKAEGDWLLEADGVSLLFSPLSGGRGQDAAGQLTSEDQLCRVEGRLGIDGIEAQISGLGWRSVVGSEPDPGGLDSLRFLAGWLDADFGFSLLALRPRKARGHETDLAVAVVLEDPPLPPVTDPRLSTTYSESGRPVKAGLELWLSEETEEAEEAEDGGSSHYPRRAAGEAVGNALDWTQGELTLQAGLVRWHSHGHTGPGVYVLGQRV